jgi:hypothetical protein
VQAAQGTTVDQQRPLPPVDIIVAEGKIIRP